MDYQISIIKANCSILVTEKNNVAFLGVVVMEMNHGYVTHCQYHAYGYHDDDDAALSRNDADIR